MISTKTHFRAQSVGSLTLRSDAAVQLWEAPVPVEGRRVAGHEKEDVRLWAGGVAADVAKRPNVAHHVQGASLVNQAGVQGHNQVGH